MFQRLASGIAPVLVLAATLVGCSGPGPLPSPTPNTSSGTPVTEDQLLNETRAAWDAHQALLSEFGASPADASRERLLEVTTSDSADTLMSNFQDAADRRIHTEGQRRTTVFELRDATDAPARIEVAVCVDVSDERIVGDEGIDLTPVDRPPLQPSLIEFIVDPGDSGYIVARQTPAADEGVNPCSQG